MKIPEEACLNCERWTPMRGRDGRCQLLGRGTDACGICLAHKRVTKKVEAERHKTVRDEDEDEDGRVC